MNRDAAILARGQFAFTVSFQIIFPTTSVGLAMFLAAVEGLWLKTTNHVYLQIYRFWLGVFAMAFGVGVVTGIVLSFEFGPGFAHFAQIGGPVTGPMPGGTLLSTLIAFIFVDAFFITAFLIFAFRMIRRGPEAAPDQTEVSASLKNVLRPQVLDNPAANAVTINAVSEGVREYALDPGNAEALCEADGITLQNCARYSRV
jgi:cytochrome bd-type quinol oxidase subunit 1